MNWRKTVRMNLIALVFFAVFAYTITVTINPGAFVTYVGALAGSYVAFWFFEIGKPIGESQ